MSDDRNEPREYDAVRGGQNLIPANAAVLGGILGVKSRLASSTVEARIAALSEALKYGEAGLELIIQALQDRSMQVEFAAYSLLKDRTEEKIEQLLLNYNPLFEFDAIAVDSSGREQSRTKSLARLFYEDLGNGIFLKMVGIPGNKFMMGWPTTEPNRRDYERPRHQVTVPTFYAGKYAITQAEWQTVMGYNPSCFKGEKRPVENVSWEDAVNFCSKLSQKTGRKYRLPSEAEWEYACRAGTTTPFHFGETITTELGNFNGDKPYANAPQGINRAQTTDVGTFPPNAFGLYDMHGNVFEWCSDVWHDTYQSAPTDGSSWKIGTDNYRVLRGGSWTHYAVACRSAIRIRGLASCRWTSVGFRVALSI
ncbi:MAG: formylglycine-generating enzyme family protein [Oscillatoriaceae cyanobacterium Prado104]|jgi:formylglycine-generating enzyme required for sulfatase activity|nr:formylglycine-generating enzyme family protein [Oscillatoriaceae cyanobacterium Prado104]